MRSAGLQQNVPALASEAFRDDLLSGMPSNPLGATIVRIRGRITCRPETYTVGAAAVVAFRVHDQTQSNVDQGPVDKPNEDWMGYTPFLFTPKFGAGAAADLDYQQPVLHSEVDIKSMRRLDDLDDTLWLYAHSHSSVVWDVTYDLSVLVMLP